MRAVSLGALGLALFLLAELAHSQNPNVAPTDPRTPAEEKKTFELPPGFDIELVAAEPDIHKPMNLAFDERGRLWVTDTVEYPFPAAGRKARDTVKILEDFDSTGRARKITTFADDLNIPIGVLPIDQGALVYSIPNILALKDSKNRGKADSRSVLFKTYGSRDTHGMTNAFTWGFDGWIYACHGFSNTSRVEAKDGSTITMQSGNVYRIKADGSHIEQWTWGQVNPFGLCFDPLGNLYSADCHSRPLYQLLRGAYYPSFGKPHDGLGFGPEMINHDHGSTAIAGVVYYAADHFPPEYRDTLFVGNVVTNRLNHDTVKHLGSTPRGIQQPDFLKSSDPWFRPVDIKLGPDGAIYVADFYNRIIGHYEVPLDHPGRDRERGRIWRIVYRGKDGKGQPTAPRSDWTKASLAELIKDLSHPNLTVRTLASNQLTKRNPREVEQAIRKVLQPSSNVWQRVHGMWVLHRLGVLDARTLLALGKDKESAVRVHAQHVLAERADLSREQHQLALAGLTDADPNVQRAAADALGRHPSPANIRPLLDLRHCVPEVDTHLMHVVRMALRDQLRPAEAWKAIPVGDWRPNDDRAIADVALGVPSPESAHFLLGFLGRQKPALNAMVTMVHHIARHGDPKTTEQLLPLVRQQAGADPGASLAFLRAIERGTQERGAPLAEPVRTWAVELAGKLLAEKNAGLVQEGITLAGALRMTDKQAPLTTLALAATTPEGQRLAALDALVNIDAGKSLETLARILQETSAPIKLREHSANLLARINRPEAQTRLVEAFQKAPARLQTVMAMGMASSPEGAEKLLQAVTTGKASARLLQERAVEVRLKERKIANLSKRLAELTRGLPAADQRVQELLTQRRKNYLAMKADPALGQKVFEKQCANCHQLGGKGARIGPQLDGIGVRGLDRLMEDTLDPNRNVDQAFRLTTLNLRSGQVVSGLLLKEEGAILVLADAQGKEVRVPKNTVDEQSTSQLSPMPANFADLIPETEYYHLLAYLLTQKTREK